MALAFPCGFAEGGNLIPNPEFLAPEGNELSPYFWHHGSTEIEGVKKSEFSSGPAGSPPLRALGIKGGEDRSGQWWCVLEGLEKGKRYRLSFRVYREEFVDGVFPEVEIFGRRMRMSNLLTFGSWQDFGIAFTAVEEATVLRFINDYPVTFYFSSPVLLRMPDAEEGKEQRAVSGQQGDGYKPLAPDFFPLVAYGAGKGDFGLVRELGFNAVVVRIGADSAEEMLLDAWKHGLRIVANPSDDASIEKITALTSTSSSTPALASSFLGWYVEDEPEGRSVPPEEIEGKTRKIRDAGSSHPAFMAMVRPEFAGPYRDSADIILMDQYPVPHHPIIWLSKSIEQAKRAGAKDVWAVIQIFGGQGWKGKGWDREPSYEEMKALSYLAIVHGARGLFFYTVKDGNYDVRRDPAHLKDVKRLVRELKHLGPYFLYPAAGTPGFFSDSLYEFAPDGTKPVHARMFRKGKELIVIAVNVTDRAVEGRLVGIGDSAYLDEFFSGRRYVVKEGNIVDYFGPYEVKIYRAGKEYRRLRILDSVTGREKGGFYAEVAESGFDRTLGLMFRELPSEDRALLLMNEKGEEMAVHALNIAEPLDIVFFDERGGITALRRGVTPCESEDACALHTSPSPPKMVLEIKAGTADKSGMTEGDRLEFY